MAVNCIAKTSVPIAPISVSATRALLARNPGAAVHKLPISIGGLRQLLQRHEKGGREISQE